MTNLTNYLNIRQYFEQRLFIPFHHLGHIKSHIISIKSVKHELFRLCLRPHIKSDKRTSLFVVH